MIDDPGCTAGSTISREPGARPHAEQPQVARDLAELDRQAPHRAGIGDDVAHALRDAESVLRAGRSGKPLKRLTFAIASVGKVGAGIEARADRGRSEVELGQAASLPARRRRRLDRGTPRSRRTPGRASSAPHPARCVRPTLSTLVERRGFLAAATPRARALARRAARGRAAARDASPIGNTSLVDCPMLTWSFGCTVVYSPRRPPRISAARLASTSLAFMLCEVPAPAW